VKHQQKGYAWRVKKSWYGRWYVPTIGENGEALWEQHSEKLCEASDQYRRRKDVQPLLDQLLAPLNNGRATPEATLTIAEYGDQHFMTWAERELKPSTVHGYQKLWKKYLRPRLGDVSLRDFRCVHATNLLATIHGEHPVGRLMLRHCKALLRTIFTYAKRNGVIDGMNPIKDAGIPRAAKKAAPTHAYTTGEVLTMLNVLDGVARASIAVMFFCGLRPGEARAIRWNDYDAEKAVMRVRASMWNCHLTE
jgi:integrase